MRDSISSILKKPICSFLLSHRRVAWLLALPLLLAVIPALNAMRPLPAPGLEGVLERGELVVVTRNDPASWYQDQHGDTGFDYELARLFAAHLGVTLKVIPVNSMQDAYTLLDEGHADMATVPHVADSGETPPLQYSRGFLTTSGLFVYRQADDRPVALENLKGQRVAVLAGSSEAVWLEQLAKRGLDLHIISVDSTETARALALVSQGDSDLAFVDSQSFGLQRPLFPELAAGFTLTEHVQLAWAMKPQTAASLRDAANRFLQETTQDGTVARLAERFYGKHNRFNLYAAQVFVRHLSERLPHYTRDFRQAGDATRFDWRLLAAMGYQESHWNAEARSPTGVRGLMMLTQNTANTLGVDRNDPAQSIDGGARYLRLLIDNLPSRITEPDRTWMALAAYNIGAAHLEDARVLTQSQGGNPDSWHDVEKRLPLLGRAEYGNYLRYGMADGKQAVRYVNNIRRYYNLLVWAGDTLENRNTLLAMLD